MIKHYCVFLRGVNVNGIRMKMVELSDAFKTMGYENVKTLLGSGNVVVTTPDDDLTLLDHKMKIEMELSLYFGYEAYVIVKELTAMKAIVEEASLHEVPGGYHHYLFLTNDDGLPQALADIHEDCQSEPQERLIVAAAGTYWIIPKGNTLQSDFGERALGDAGFRSRLTSRTMNTVRKVYRVLLEREE